MYYFWFIALLLVGIYCITRAVLDFRTKKYVWAVFGLVCGGLILTVPIKMNAVKIDLPVPSSEFAEQPSMQIEIFAGENLIGHSYLTTLAPGLGLASGSFVPTEAYDRKVHAKLFERDHIDDPSKMLVIQSSDYGRIACDIVKIEDYSEDLGEIDIVLADIPDPEFERLFSKHEQYRAYYGLD